MNKEIVKIGGMTCAACASRIEKVLGKKEGVLRVSVNFATEKATVEYDPQKTRFSEIKQVIEKIGYEVINIEKKAAVDEDKLRKEKEIRTLWRKFIIAAIFTAPLLYLAMVPMISWLPFPIPGFLEPMHFPLRYALTQLALVIPVIIAGNKFYTVGYKALIQRSPNMDSLIAIGTTAAVIYSLYSTYQISIDNTHAVEGLYFETAGVIITLILLMNNMRKKILVVDDEAKIVEIVKSYFENSGYSVCEAYNGKEALEKFEKENPALVILDLMLPDLTGEEICKTLRKKSRVPIIMLTAKVEEEDILKGLNLGADDYVTKPFSPRQLVARAEAVLRRASDSLVPLSSIISFNNDELVIDTLKYEVKRHGEIINLTPNEYKLLLAMVKYPDKTFTREELISIGLGDDFNGYDRTIDTHIKNIRQKIEPDPKNPKYILTVHGIGYRFGGE